MKMSQPQTSELKYELLVLSNDGAYQKDQVTITLGAANTESFECSFKPI